MVGGVARAANRLVPSGDGPLHTRQGQAEMPQGWEGRASSLMPRGQPLTLSEVRGLVYGISIH
jgi:hypothetical protein